MKKLIYIKKYIVFALQRRDFKPFFRTIGQIKLDPVGYDNVHEVIDSFPDMHDPFVEMLSLGDTGVFARHNGQIVGYLWRKDFNCNRKFKSDGYLPLQGNCSHLHWARVKNEMRGRGLQPIMLTWLIQDAHVKGIDRIYTDVEIGNEISKKGIEKIGFKKQFKIFVIKTDYNWRTVTVKY